MCACNTPQHVTQGIDAIATGQHLAAFHRRVFLQSCMQGWACAAWLPVHLHQVQRCPGVQMCVWGCVFVGVLPLPMYHVQGAPHPTRCCCRCCPRHCPCRCPCCCNCCPFGVLHELWRTQDQGQVCQGLVLQVLHQAIQGKRLHQKMCMRVWGNGAQGRPQAPGACNRYMHGAQPFCRHVWLWQPLEAHQSRDVQVVHGHDCIEACNREQQV